MSDEDNVIRFRPKAEDHSPQQVIETLAEVAADVAFITVALVKKDGTWFVHRSKGDMRDNCTAVALLETDLHTKLAEGRQ